MRTWRTHWGRIMWARLVSSHCLKTVYWKSRIRVSTFRQKQTSEVTRLTNITHDTILTRYHIRLPDVITNEKKGHKRRDVGYGYHSSLSLTSLPKAHLPVKTKIYLKNWRLQNWRSILCWSELGFRGSRRVTTEESDTTPGMGLSGNVCPRLLLTINNTQ